MNKLISLILKKCPENYIQLTLALLRIFLGILIVIHGYPKISGGVETWRSLGIHMENLGINFLPAMWGFFAAIAQFFGGLTFILGFATRFSSFLIAFTMLIATIMLIQKGQPFTIYSHSLSLLIIFLSYIILGGGKYSIDNYILTKLKN